MNPTSGDESGTEAPEPHGSANEALARGGYRDGRPAPTPGPVASSGLPGEAPQSVRQIRTAAAVHSGACCAAVMRQSMQGWTPGRRICSWARRGGSTANEMHREHVDQVVQGRKMRLDTTVVETNIHYPTDSNLLGDGVRVLIRAMKRIADIAGQQGAKLRDGSRSVRFRILEIGRIARTRGGPNRERLQQGYEKLLSTVGRVAGQAKRFSGEIVEGVKRSAEVMQQAALEGLRKELDTFVPRVQQVMRQAKQRIFGGNTHVAEKLVSIFEPTTEIIRKGKASKLVLAASEKPQPWMEPIRKIAGDLFQALIHKHVARIAPGVRFARIPARRNHRRDAVVKRTRQQRLLPVARVAADGDLVLVHFRQGVKRSAEHTP